MRKKTIAFCGGAFGDEGKGRIVDEYVNNFAAQGRVVVYRDNGGANAGHTVEFAQGKRVALHQLLSGVFSDQATLILGKGMVVHPGDLLTEMAEVRQATGGTIPAQVKIDELAAASLDTHRAYESVLKQWHTGGSGSTGRGISPAYADILYRHPVQMRDLAPFNQSVVEKHYQLYEALVRGLGQDLATIAVPTLTGETQLVGDQATFVNRLRDQSEQLQSNIQDVTQFLTETWADEHYAFVFEKAQGIGLDARWGVYPDVTASDSTFDGIYSSTEGIINPQDIAIRAAVLKATYMSSVGARKLPTLITDPLADRIREDAHEYGATTKRPRDIAYLDLPALKFFSRVGKVTHLVLTHMDISYLDQPIKVCTHYEVNGAQVAYRPDQVFLNTVTPVYEELDPWDSGKIQAARSAQDIPKQAQDFLAFLELKLGLPILLITTGARRDQTVMLV